MAGTPKGAHDDVPETSILVFYTWLAARSGGPAHKLLSFDPSFPLFLSLFFSLSLLLLILDRTDVCSPLLRLFPTQFRAKSTYRAKKKRKTPIV